MRAEHRKVSFGFLSYSLPLDPESSRAFGSGFFKKSQPAFLVDNLKNVAKGNRTQPDWWQEVRRAEARIQAKSQAASAEMTPSAVPELSDEARQSYERIAKEMFAVFRAGGQPKSAAKVNAETFAQKYIQRPNTDLDRPLFGGVKA